LELEELARLSFWSGCILLFCVLFSFSSKLELKINLLGSQMYKLEHNFQHCTFYENKAPFLCAYNWMIPRVIQCYGEDWVLPLFFSFLFGQEIFFWLSRRERKVVHFGAKDVRISMGKSLFLGSQKYCIWFH